MDGLSPPPPFPMKERTMPKYRIVVEIDQDYGEETTPEQVLQEFVWSVSDLLADFGYNPKKSLISAAEERTQWLDICVSKVRWENSLREARDNEVEE